MLTVEQLPVSQLMEDSDYIEPSHQVSFASGLQFFSVFVYLLSHGFTIPVLPIGPSWAVWFRLDDFATLFLFLVYLSTRRNTRPMEKTERLVLSLIVVGIVFSFPSILVGKLMRPEIIKGPHFGIFQTYRVIQYVTVWFCIRGMSFSSKQFDKISYTVFFITLFTVIIGFGNVTGVISASRLVSHLPYDGPWIFVHQKVGSSRTLGPYGYLSGEMVDRMVFLTMILLASRKPRAIFRISLVALIACVVFLSGARAASIAWCVALAIFSCKKAKQLIIAPIVIVLMFVVLRMLPADNRIVEYSTRRISTIVHREEDITMAGRTIQWQEVLETIASDGRIPFMGVGWGFGGQVLGGAGNAHCMVLQVLLELGILGLLLFLLLLFGDVPAAARKRSTPNRKLRAGFLGLLVASLTREVFYPVSSSGSFLGLVAAVFAISTAACKGRMLEEQYCCEEYEFAGQEEELIFQYSV